MHGGQRAFCERGHLGERVLDDRRDQVFLRGEVPVQRADGDACRPALPEPRLQGAHMQLIEGDATNPGHEPPQPAHVVADAAFERLWNADSLTWADIEKACNPPTKRTQSAFAQIYGYLAHDAATHDDCERYQTFYRKYLEVNGSVSEMMAWAKP